MVFTWCCSCLVDHLRLIHSTDLSLDSFKAVGVPFLRLMKTLGFRESPKSTLMCGLMKSSIRPSVQMLQLLVPKWLSGKKV